MPALLLRAETGVNTLWTRRTIAALNVLVLIGALLPFVLWETFGPARFEALDLGRDPGSVALGIDGRPEAADDGADLRAAELYAPHIALDLGPGVVTTLIYSVGSRGLSDAEASRLRIDDLDQRGADGLTDTLMVLVADTNTQQAALLSIPRDLWVFHRGHRINASFNRHGTQGLVDDVSLVTGLPIDHVIRLNFSAFANLVDAVGGVALSVDEPMADLASVLYVPRAGCWRFDGAAGLAYVRSRRTLTRTASGDWVADSSASDFGRISRQQQLLGAVWDQIRGPSILPRIPDLLATARDGLVVDRGLGVQQVRDLMTTFGQVAAGGIENFTLPTVGRRIGQAAAQVIDNAPAEPIIRRLRTWPPEAGDAAALARTDLLAAGVLAADVVATDVVALPSGCATSAALRLPDPRGPLGVIAGGGDPAYDPADHQPDQPEPTTEPSPTGEETGSEDPSPAPTESGEATEPDEGGPSPWPLPTLPFP